MISFQDVITQFDQIVTEFNVEKTTRGSVVEYTTEIFSEKVNILFLKTSLTGSERPRPQIRVFTEKIIELANRSLENNERFFCFIHCSHSVDQLKFEHVKPYEYVVSLESDWNMAAGRIDVRSIYNNLENNVNLDYLKVNSSQHSTPSIRQAALFKLNETGFKNVLQYLRFFDSRLISRDEKPSHDDLPLDDEIEEEKVDLASTASLVSQGVNRIYFGAPGTGKSFRIQRFIRENGIENYEEKTGHPNVFRTTCHPEFTYHDFVGQVMPVVIPDKDDPSKTRIEYKFEPKVFTKALARSLAEGVVEKQPVFLILEEMSRANVAAVFGDLFQLLDRDSMTGESEYKINNDLISQFVYNRDQQIYLPSNLFIIGTVNTNDQNVFVMDTAFKRRFEFDYVSANSVVMSEGQPINNFEFELKDNGVSITFQWISLYGALNRFITKKVEKGGLGLKEDKQLGQFFIKFRDGDDEYNYNQIKGKLLQYLYDDIEEEAYTGQSLFNEEINSFGDAYLSLNKNLAIFSSEFMQEYERFVRKTAQEGLESDV
ncbi:AAA family ATPase [Evansella tamaricis]|uniref:AAA family ATPase n=1 Tax=Evansella tamaricis TaxID=2069301 RepID=A0ABS6JEA2_9BACI|nr:AAA family ATPase [Evansella tamaricis]MBU9712002.1 AAA family ATPase [Evansella tamaricis]